MSASLDELVMLERHWHFAPAPNDLWRGLIYAPDGVTVSYSTKPRETIEDACADLIRTWAWHRSLENVEV